MSRKKTLQVVFPLETEELFLKAIEDSSKYLTVVDLHQNWCGPVSAMEPLYRKAYIELDSPEHRVKFYTMDIDKISPENRVGLPISESCKPLFVVYKVRGESRAL